MKTRTISYAEIDAHFRDLLAELAKEPIDEAAILEKSKSAVFLLGVCISQLSAPSSQSYPGKDDDLKRLKQAGDAITFSLNACTVEEVANQVTVASRAFEPH